MPTVDNFLARRVAPQFCIVDRYMNVLYKTADAVEGALIELARPYIMAGTSPVPATTVPIDDTSRMRIVPVSGAWTAAYALFVERAGERGSLEAAAKKYGLTPREVDVLRLIVAHRSSAQIAAELHIAESTVSDHVKSLFRKIQCNRRTELFAALYDV